MALSNMNDCVFMRQENLQCLFTRLPVDATRKRICVDELSNVGDGVRVVKPAHHSVTPRQRVNQGVLLVTMAYRNVTMGMIMCTSCTYRPMKGEEG